MQKVTGVRGENRKERERLRNKQGRGLLLTVMYFPALLQPFFVK
jgi:hypothetical protein